MHASSSSAAKRAQLFGLLLITEAQKRGREIEYDTVPPGLAVSVFYDYLQGRGGLAAVAKSVKASDVFFQAMAASMAAHGCEGSTSVLRGICDGAPDDLERCSTMQLITKLVIASGLVKAFVRLVDGFSFLDEYSEAEVASAFSGLVNCPSPPAFASASASASTP